VPATAPPVAQQPPAGAPSGEAPRPQAPPAGGLAQWDARAYAALVDIAVGAGLLTFYQMTLAMVSPLVRVLVWLVDLFGGDYGAFVRFSFWVVIGGWWGWQWVQRGITGQTLGQKLMGVAVVDQETRKPIGPARSLVRSLTHVVDILPLWIGFARPVWDKDRQTWADKIHKTIAVNVAPPPR
jgi:uncharacterized RDD family membrane protein YckC